MPVRFLVSTELGLSLLVFEGVVTDEEFRRDIVPLISDPAFNTMARTLVDTTAATSSDAPGELMREAARTAASQVDEKVDAGSRVAVAAPADVFFGLGRMYQALRAESPVEVGVFRSLDAAEQWLGLPAGYREKLAPGR